MVALAKARLAVMGSDQFRKQIERRDQLVPWNGVGQTIGCPRTGKLLIAVKTKGTCTVHLVGAKPTFQTRKDKDESLSLEGGLCSASVRDAYNISRHKQAACQPDSLLTSRTKPLQKFFLYHMSTLDRSGSLKGTRSKLRWANLHIERQIGRGQSGLVYRGAYKGQSVAIKQLANDGHALERDERRARKKEVLRFQHPF